MSTWARTRQAFFFEKVLLPELLSCGAKVLGDYAKEHSENSFPPLPVRGEDVFVWFMRFADRSAYERFSSEVAQSPKRKEITGHLRGVLNRPEEVLLLQPTSRSLL
ncbi:hypothetical protein [Cohnella lubricantis]|nr:hypothetical protein [Cohnella lubricantis]MBP2118139.1 hypothetical protein [Cohnella lubricantis]